MPCKSGAALVLLSGCPRDRIRAGATGGSGGRRQFGDQRCTVWSGQSERAQRPQRNRKRVEDAAARHQHAGAAGHLRTDRFAIDTNRDALCGRAVTADHHAGSGEIESIVPTARRRSAPTREFAGDVSSLKPTTEVAFHNGQCPNCRRHGPHRFACALCGVRCERPRRTARTGRANLVEDACAGWAVCLCVDAEFRIVSSCMLITVPNLLRGGRQHGILENVVTHPQFQGRGHGRAVVSAALAEAWKMDCHHVLMQSGRADPAVHRFYESCGFKPGLRTAYAALRPADSR